MKKRNTLSCLLWVFCLCDKIKTPFRLKNSWNRQIMLARAWQVLNMKCMQWPETEIYLQRIERSYSTWTKETLSPVFFGYFTSGSVTKLRHHRWMTLLDWRTREIDRSYLCLQQFDKFWIWSACNDRKRKFISNELKKVIQNEEKKHLFLSSLGILPNLWQN